MLIFYSISFSIFPFSLTDSLRQFPFLSITQTKSMIPIKINWKPNIRTALKIFNIMAFCHMNPCIGPFHPENISALGMKSGMCVISDAGISHVLPRPKQILCSKIFCLIRTPGSKVRGNHIIIIFSFYQCSRFSPERYIQSAPILCKGEIILRKSDNMQTPVLSHLPVINKESASVLIFICCTRL